MKKKLHFKNISLDFNEGNVLLTIKEHSSLIILKKKILMTGQHTFYLLCNKMSLCTRANKKLISGWIINRTGCYSKKHMHSSN